MTWNYRFVRVGDEVGLYEVYYDDDGKPVMRTEDPVTFVGDNLHEASKDLRLALRAISDGVLHDDEIGTSE